MNSECGKNLLCVWRYLVVLGFALWIGGFTFHTSVTLRVGGDVIGGLAQGYVTQAALGRLHLFAGAMTLLAAIDLAIHWRCMGRIARGVQCAAAGIMALCLLMLVSIHGDMSALLDADGMSRPDPAVFAPLHQRYQFFASILWVCAMTGLGNVLRAHRCAGIDIPLRKKTPVRP